MSENNYKFFYLIYFIIIKYKKCKAKIKFLNYILKNFKLKYELNQSLSKIVISFNCKSKALLIG